MKNESTIPAAESEVREHGIIARQTAKSGTWTVGARLLSRAVDMSSMLVLARLLTPKDFGLVALAMTVIFVVEALLEMPLSQALVCIRSPDASHYDTAFTLSLLRGVAVSGVVCAVSFPFAAAYAEPRLIPLVCLLGVAPAARGFVSPCLADYARRLDFSREFIVEIIGKTAAFLVAITLAFSLRTYWAIAAGTITSPLIASVASYVAAPYRPRLSLRQLHAFSGFLGWITVAQTISALNWQSDRLLLGKLTSQSSLGFFTTANDLSSIPVMTFFGPLLRPLLSAFALVRGHPERLAASYQISSCALITLGLPILAGESLLAEPAVRFLFGYKWLGAVPMLRWLALSLIPSLIAIPIGPLVMSLNRTDIFVKRNLLEFCVKIPLVVVGAIRSGFFGVIIARCVSEAVTALFCMFIVRDLVGLSCWKQLASPWRTASSTLGMVAVTAVCTPHLLNLHSKLLLGTGLFLTVLTAAAVYCAILLLLWLASGRPHSPESIALRWASRHLHRPVRQAVTSPL